MFINIKIDDKYFKAIKGDTILKTAIRLNIDIPHLCTNNFLKSDFNKCSMCLVSVKYKVKEEAASKEAENKEIKSEELNNEEINIDKTENDNEYKKVFACECIAEEDMIILNEKSEYIKKYRTSILNSIAATHKPVCNNCNVYTICKLKNYFEKYNIKNDESVKKTENAIEKSKEEEKLLEEIDMNSKRERCIECGVCKTYIKKFMANNYKTKIFNLCPTKVFLPKKLYDIDFNKSEKKESYCIDCENMCECKTLLYSKNIILLEGNENSKYGICDFAFQMKSQEKLSPLIYILKNGFEKNIVKARDLYNNFFKNFQSENKYAFISSYFPINDIDAAEEEIKRLNIENYFFENTKINTDSSVKKRAMSNFNYVLKQKDKNKISGNFFKNDYPKNSAFFIIASPHILKDNDFINFTEHNEGNYIIFTSYHTEAARNAFLAFPIKMFGEFEGEYINRENRKRIINFEEKENIERYSLTDIFNFLKS